MFSLHIYLVFFINPFVGTTSSFHASINKYHASKFVPPGGVCETPSTGKGGRRIASGTEGEATVQPSATETSWSEDFFPFLVIVIVFIFPSKRNPFVASAGEP